MEAENDNLRAALRWCLDTRNAELGLRLAGALGFFWMARNHNMEGRDWLASILSLPHATKRTPMRARALNAAVLLNRFAGSTAARAFAEESLAIYRELGDKRGVIRSLDGLGFALFVQGCHSLARSYFQESLNIARESDDKQGIGIALNHLGDVAQSFGDYAAARPFFAESVQVLRETQDKSNYAISLFDLGGVELALGEYAEARAQFEQALRLGRELDIKLSIAWTLQYQGNVEWCQGNYQAARPFYEQAMVAYREMGQRWAVATGRFALANLAFIEGDYVTAVALYQELLEIARADNIRLGIPDGLFALANVARRQGDYGAAQRLYGESLEERLSFPDKPKIADLLEAFGAVATDLGEADRAVRLFAAAEAHRETIGIPVARHHILEGHVILPLADRAERDRNLVVVRRALGEARYAAAWAAGHAMSLEEAITFAKTEPTTRLESAEPELRIFALGPIRVYRGNRLLTPSDWTLAKAKELLFYLLSNDASTKEQIGLDLWQEASPAQLRGNLHIALHHLRRALGDRQWVVFENDRYSFNRALAPRYWFDVETFESNLSQARQVQAKSPGQSIRYLKEATQFYRGDFLDEMTVGDWYLVPREELRKKHLEALLTLGQLLFAEGSFGEAGDVYLRIIHHDAYLEAAHRELMRCYARQGELSQALRHYRMLVDLLRSELGAAPAPETTTLFERLRRGEPA